MTADPPEINLADGIYFDPSGEFLFVANRSITFLPAGESNNLTVLSRPRDHSVGGVAGELLPSLSPLIIDDDQIVQHIVMSSEPDGVAFHETEGFVVTLNESDGTMTRFDFTGNDFTTPPAQTLFASGGFRGDLIQVGADGCLYGTQGFLDVNPLDPPGPGTRYDDGTETTDGSVVRICGGFAPPPGLEPPDGPVEFSTLLCPVDDPSGIHPAGTITSSVAANGDVTVRYEQSRDVADNSYGATAIGWSADRPLGKLVSSDKAQVGFRDSNGVLVLEFLVDYLSADSSRPSGFGSLGIDGDGQLGVGDASHILDLTTSLDGNLNEYCTPGNCVVNGVDLLVDSPPADGAYAVLDPVFSEWNFSSVYVMTISGDAFGAAGFGSVTVDEIHNSPAKTGSNKIIPVECPTAGAPPPSTCLECKGGVTSLTLHYLGDTAAAVQVRDKDGSVVFDGVVLADGVFSFTGIKKDGKLGTEISISRDGAEHATIHTSCSQPIGPGLVFGDFEVVSGGSLEGGALCLLPGKSKSKSKKGKSKSKKSDDDAGNGALCMKGTKPRILTMEYTGADCFASAHTQASDKVSCSGDPASASPVHVIADNGKAKVWFDGVVNLNDAIAIDAANGGDTKLESNTRVRLFDPLSGSLLQSVELHTSCSQPLNPGDQFGALKALGVTPQ